MRFQVLSPLYDPHRSRQTSQSPTFHDFSSAAGMPDQGPTIHLAIFTPHHSGCHAAPAAKWASFISYGPRFPSKLLDSSR